VSERNKTTEVERYTSAVEMRANHPNLSIDELRCLRDFLFAEITSTQLHDDLVRELKALFGDV
jgi:hypothetical protein